MDDVYEVVSFWKPILKVASEALESTIGGAAFSIDAAIIKIDSFIENNTSVSLYQKRIPLNTKQTKNADGFNRQQSEFFIACEIMHIAIYRVIGFNFYKKGVPQAVKEELSEFFAKEKENYLYQKCPFELYNSIRYFVTHRKAYCCRELLVQMVARDLLNHYGEFLLKYQDYGKRD